MEAVKPIALKRREVTLEKIEYKKILDDSFSGAFHRNYTSIQSGKAILIDLVLFWFLRWVNNFEWRTKLPTKSLQVECVINHNASRFYQAIY